MKARLAILALASLLPVVAAAQSTQFSLTLGYQWLDITGNEDVFRSQTGQDDGFLLRSFSLTTTGDGLYDRLRLDVSGFGAAADGRIRLTAERAGAYRLSFNGRRSEAFSALPALANPFAELGVIPGQRTFDRTRTSLDLDLELMPGRVVSPLIGYSRHVYDGPGRTALTFGGDEFVMRDEIDETVDELRVGANVRLGSFNATVLQGWRRVDSRERFSLVPGAGGGFSSRPVLGRDVTLTDFDREARIDGDSPVTTALLTGQLGARVRVTATFARSNMDSEVMEREAASGSLVSFAIGRFFGGLAEETRTRADGPAWRGEARVEAELVSWLDLVGSYTRSNRETSGRGLITGLYTGTTNFSGADPRDITETLSIRNAFERDEAIAEARLIARPVRGLRLWAGYATVSQETTIAPDAAEIVVPLGQGGRFERDIDRISAGASLELGPARLVLDYQRDDADAAIVRTDVLDRDRLRARASVQASSFLRFSGTWEEIDFSNPTPGIDFDGTSSSWMLSADVTPIAALTFTVGYGRNDADTSIIVRRPQDFVLEPSLWAEDGETLDAHLRLALGRFTATGGHSRFENEGSFALELERSYLEAGFELTPTLGVSALYETRDYTQTSFRLASYEADRFGVFLRFGGR